MGSRRRRQLRDRLAAADQLAYHLAIGPRTVCLSQTNNDPARAWVCGRLVKVSEVVAGPPAEIEAFANDLKEK